MRKKEFSELYLNHKKVKFGRINPSHISHHRIIPTMHEQDKSSLYYSNIDICRNIDRPKGRTYIIGKSGSNCRDEKAFARA